MHKYFEKTVEKKEIFKGKIVDLSLEKVLLPNGLISEREIVRHLPAVAIIAITDDNKIILVEQYRKAVQKALFELPAGVLNSLHEEPLCAAKRELEEETNYVAKNWEYLSRFYTAPGFCDEKISLFLAKGLSIKENAAPPDEGELIDVHAVDIDEALHWIELGKIVDAKTIIGLQYLARKMKK